MEMTWELLDLHNARGMPEGGPCVQRAVSPMLDMQESDLTVLIRVLLSYESVAAEKDVGVGERSQAVEAVSKSRRESSNGACFLPPSPASLCDPVEDEDNTNRSVRYSQQNFSVAEAFIADSVFGTEDSSTMLPFEIHSVASSSRLSDAPAPAPSPSPSPSPSIVSVPTSAPSPSPSIVSVPSSVGPIRTQTSQPQRTFKCNI